MEETSFSKTYYLPIKDSDGFTEVQVLYFFVCNQSEPEKSHVDEEDVSQNLNHIATKHSQDIAATEASHEPQESSITTSQVNRLQAREASNTPTTRVVVGQEATAAHTRTDKMSNLLQSE